MTEIPGELFVEGQADEMRKMIASTCELKCSECHSEIEVGSSYEVYVHSGMPDSENRYRVCSGCCLLRDKFLGDHDDNYSIEEMWSLVVEKQLVIMPDVLEKLPYHLRRTIVKWTESVLDKIKLRRRAEAAPCGRSRYEAPAPDYEHTVLQSVKFVASEDVGCCVECGNYIRKGESYEYCIYRKRGEFYGDPFAMITCATCLSIREVFFPGGWAVMRMMDDLWASLDTERISPWCLDKLSPGARERIVGAIDYEIEFEAKREVEYAARMAKEKSCE